MAIWYFKNPRLVVLTIAFILFTGTLSLFTLPRREDPASAVRWGFVLTRAPGTQASRVETLITEPLEIQVRELEGVKSIESYSHQGISVLLVQLSDSVSEVDVIWSKLRDRLRAATSLLPPDVGVPELISDDLWDAYTFVLALQWNGTDPAEMGILTRVAKDLENQIRYVSGTRHTRLFGEGIEEVLVEVDPQQLSSRMVTPADVSRIVTRSDAKVSSAPVRTEQSSMLLDISGELDSLEAIRRIVIRHGDEGDIVRLADIASVNRSIKTPPSKTSWIEGKRSIVIAARLATGHNINDWTRKTRNIISELQRDLPGTIVCKEIFRQQKYTDERTNHLLGNLRLGMVFVIGVIWLMMGWRQVLPICSSLPLSVMMVLSGMAFLGISIEQMSIMGLILALGLLIDNPIIATDHLEKEMAAGATPLAAVRSMQRSLSIPLAASTLTTILAFMPLILIDGPTGEFLRSLATSVILALASSLFLSLTIVPSVAVWAWKNSDLGNRSVGWRDRLGTRIKNVAAGKFDWLLARPLVALLISLLLPIGGFAVQPLLDEQFFPAADRDHFHVQLRLPSHAALASTARATMRAREILLPDSAVEEVHWFVGGNAPKIHYSMIGGDDDQPSFAHGIVQLNTSLDTRDVIRRLQQSLEENISEAHVICRLIEQGPPALAPIEYRIYGPDLATLQDLGEQARAVMSNMENIRDARTTLPPGSPKLMLKNREEASLRTGLTNAGIANQLAAGWEGVVGGSLKEGTEELPIRIRFAGANQNELSEIISASVLSETSSERSGNWIPITALADLSIVTDVASIPRRNGRRCNIVQGFPALGELPAEVEKQFLAEMTRAGFTLPRGYDFDLGGSSTERDAAVQQLIAPFALLGAVIGCVLVLSFRSFRLAAIIAAVAIMAMGISFGMLWIFGYPFGMLAIIGTMGMVGVAINDSIVVLAALNENELIRQGDVTAARETMVGSARHVFATSLTTAAGFTPLVVGGGDMWPPLAIVIAGGVAGATVLALVFVPAAFMQLIAGRPSR